MKNITLSVPDEIYRKARIAAARRDTSVSALVAESLRILATGAEDVNSVRRRLLTKAFATAATGRAGRLFLREELYDRDGNDRSGANVDRLHRLTDSV